MEPKPDPQSPKRILVAGIGNAWMKDDAFGGKVAERLERDAARAGVRSSTSAPAASTSPTR